MSFLDTPDISYCKPGRKDTVYCEKYSNGEKFSSHNIIFCGHIKKLLVYIIQKTNCKSQFRQSLVEITFLISQQYTRR